MTHTVKSFKNAVNEAEVDVFLELSCLFYDPTDVVNLIPGSSAFSKFSLNIWNFLVHILLKLAWTILMDLWKLCHIHTSLLRSTPQSTGKPHFLHFTLLQFADGAFFFLGKLKFYGNDAWSKSVSAFYSAAFAHLLFLCHAVVILTYFNLFHHYYILWFSRWESKFVERIRNWMTLGSSITTKGTTKQWNNDSTMPKKMPTVYSILKLSITCQGSLKDIFLTQDPNTFTSIEFLLKGLLKDDFCLKREQTKKRRWWEIHNRKDTTQERSEKRLQNSGEWRSQGDDWTPDVDIPGPMWHRKQTWGGLSTPCPLWWCHL